MKCALILDFPLLANMLCFGMTSCICPFLKENIILSKSSINMSSIQCGAIFRACDIISYPIPGGTCDDATCQNGGACNDDGTCDCSGTTYIGTLCDIYVSAHQSGDLHAHIQFVTSSVKYTIDQLKTWWIHYMSSRGTSYSELFL